MPNKTYTYKRPCRRCNRIFRPSGKKTYICPKCRLKGVALRKKQNMLKKKASKKKK